MDYVKYNFWGQKNNGYVLRQAIKHDLNASRELAEFIRDKATIKVMA